MSLAHVNNAFQRHSVAEIEGILSEDILNSRVTLLEYVNNTLFLKQQVS